MKSASLDAMKRIKASPLEKLMSDLPVDPQGTLTGVRLLQVLAMNRCEGGVREMPGPGHWEHRDGQLPRHGWALCFRYISNGYAPAADPWSVIGDRKIGEQ